LTYDITLAKVDFVGLPPARMPTRAPMTTELIEHEPEEDIELSETENILADYIHALPACPAGVIVAEAAPEQSGKAVSQNSETSHE
jgi:hypothetical protein